MTAKRRNPSGPRWGMVFEEMRSQNRATLEYAETIRVSLEQRIDHLGHDLGAKITTLEMAFRELRSDVRGLQSEVRGLQGDVRGLQGDVHGLQGDVHGLQGDVRTLQGEVSGLSGKVDTLVPLDARVTAIEKRLG